MHKKSFFSRLRVLSKPTGRLQWSQAARAVILMVLAGLVAKLLGLDNGIQVILFITLIATIMMDISLPLRKVIPLAVVGFFMTVLAFLSAYLALSNVLIFILFTVLWSFFGLSTYIFGESVGYFGFLIFDAYFLAVILVNYKSTAPEWILYVIISFLIASILLIPRIWRRKQELSKMVAVGFNTQNSLKNVLNTRHALSGIPLNFKQYELLRIGTYLTGFRGYGKILLSRLSGGEQDKFNEVLEIIDDDSSKIAEGIINDSKQVDLGDLDKEVSIIDQEIISSKEGYFYGFVDAVHQMRNLLRKANELLINEDTGEEKKKLFSSQNSLREVIQANFNLKNMYIRHALRFSLAITIGLLLVYLTHNRDAIWVTMGILIIIKPDITSTVNNMILRVSFNVVAIILAIILGFIFPHQILVWLAFIMLFFFRAFFPNYMGLSVMALTVFIVLLWPTGTVFDNALARLVDISLGALIAFICAYIILPSRVTVNLPGQVAKTIRSNQEYIQKVLVDSDSYTHGEAVKSFNKYMLEDNNLEAAIRKLQDFFTDVSEDISIYQELEAANRKLSADVSAVATILENEKESAPNISLTNKKLITTLENLSEIMDGKIKTLKHYEKISFNLEDYPLKSLKQYLTWIVYDVNLIQEIVKTVIENDAIDKYRKLT